MDVERAEPLAHWLADGAHVRCIAPLSVDGGTRFRLPEQALPPDEFSRIPRCLLDAAEKVEDGERHQIRLVEDDGRELWADAWREGATRIVIEVEHCARITWDRMSGEVQMVARAVELYAQGIEAWLERWIANATFWCRGISGLQAYAAHEAGWITTRLDLNSDYTGFALAAADADNWTGMRNVARQKIVRGREDNVRTWGRPGSIETIEVGAKTGRCAWVIYNKQREIEVQKRGEWATYAATWRAHGLDWDSDRPPPVWRAELRLRAEALTLTRPDGTVIELRDPWSLTDRAALSEVWSAMAARKRLAVPIAGNGRRRQWPTDPRWQAVIDTRPDGVEPRSIVRLRQTRRVNREFWEEARRRALRKIAAGIAHLAALHDADPRSRSEAAQAATHSVQRLLSEVDLADLADASQAYRKRQEAICGEECRQQRHWWRRYERE